MSLADRFGSWWERQSETTKRIIITVLFSTPGTIVGVWGLWDRVTGYLDAETVSFVSVTGGNTFAAYEGLSEADKVKVKGYKLTTEFPLHNATSKSLSQVWYNTKKPGHFTLVSGDGKVVLSVPNDSGVRIGSVLPGEAYSLTLWHNEPWGRDEEVVITSEGTKKARMKPGIEDDRVAAWYAWGFWSLLILATISVAWDAVKVVRRRLGATTASPAPAAAVEPPALPQDPPVVPLAPRPQQQPGSNGGKAVKTSKKGRRRR